MFTPNLYSHFLIFWDDWDNHSWDKIVKTKNPITWAFISMPDFKLYLQYLKSDTCQKKNQIQYP